MPRYVILRHETPHRVHFDFMLELDGALKTWSLPEPPRPGAAIECQALADHRLMYLDYEGPISGGRGTVARWDHGTCTIQSQSDEQWAIELVGDRLVGKATLRRDRDAPDRWKLSFAGKMPRSQGE
jgi:hypothetical protein